MSPALRNVILAAAVAAVFAGSLWWFHYIPDDAYIGMRYARNLADGEGLVFNPGERVEGYTNFLWVIVLAAAARAGIPIVSGARILGLLFSAGTLVLAWRACNTVIPEKEKTLAGAGIAFAAPLFLAASAPFATWALSGTEIPMFTFLLTAGMLLLSTGRGVIPVFTVFAVLTLVRPEGAAFYLLAAFLLIVRGEKARSVAAGGILVAAILLAPYIVWKISWFGSVLPNTFYAKTGAAAQQLRNGLAYTTRFAAWYIWFPAAALLFRRSGALTIIPLSIIVLDWIIVTALGGDWMPRHRLLVPSLPAIAVMAAAAIPRVVMRQQAGDRGRGGAWQSIALAVILASVAMAPGSSGYAAFRHERLTVKALSLIHNSEPTRL